jgi:ADP-ribosylglycohydrolase
MSNGAPAQPLPNTYWVIPGRLLAGEYPGGPDPAEARERVQRLLIAGVDFFLDLTMAGELPPYTPELPPHVEHVRKSIRDHGVPSRRAYMADILECLQGALEAGRCVYVHCRAGIGRTGTVVGCLLAERGAVGDAALNELNRLWLQCARSGRWPCVPETEEQTEFVRKWQPALKLDPAAQGVVPHVARTMRERYHGALFGLAVGDALGVSTQYSQRGTFAPVVDITGGGPFELPRGAWSDDTAMALCLAESLLECRGFDARDQVERYSRWQQEGYLSATGRSVGITASTSRALVAARWRRQLFAGSHDPRQLDPEPLSRVAPVVMYFHSSPDQVQDLAGEAARITCQAPRVLEGCRLFAALLHQAFSGKAKAEVLRPDWEPRSDAAGARLKAIAQGRYRTKDALEIRTGDNITEVLEAAVWAFERTSTFAEGALLAANLGGNSDVVCAAYGQLAGAFYGSDAIPTSWRNALMQKEVIESLAEELLQRVETGEAG